MSARGEKTARKVGRKTRDDLWEHFCYINNENKTECTVPDHKGEPCGHKMGGKKTAHLKRHLETTHPEVSAQRSTMDTRLREFLMERKLEDVIQKLEDENIDETVIPLMTDSDLAKYIPKVGDRVSTVAFCRQVALSQKSPSRKESILSRLRQRLSGAEGMPPKKKSSQWVGNTSAKRGVRRIEVGWMDFDEEEERYKQVKSVNGGGTRHLSVNKGETVANIKVMAENLFFPKGHSKKNKSLSHYSTHIESSQIHVDVSSTIDELYNQSKVKILRLYLCTKKKTGQHPLRLKGDHATRQPMVVDLTDNEKNQAIEDLLVENRNSESPNHYGINDGSSTSGYLELNDTLPWDGLLTLGDSEDSNIVIITSVDDRLDVTVDEQNLETPFPEKEDDVPYQTADHSPVAAEEADVPAQIIPEPLSCPVTLIVRRGHCLTDLISAFKDPKIIASEVNIKMRLPNGELEHGEGSGVLRDCLTEFWMDFYDSCTLGVEVKVPFIRHDFQCEEWQAVARVFVVGWKQAGYFPLKLAIPFLEEVLYGSTTSSFKDSLLLYVSHEERSVLLKALEDFNSVDIDELLDVLDAHECKQIPTKDTLLPVLAQIGHKVTIQAPMYVIECWRPVVGSVAGLPPPEGLHHFIAQKTPTSKTVKELLNFPEEMTAAQSTVSRYLKRYIGEIDGNKLQLFLRFCTGSDLLDKAILIEFIETTDFLRRPQSHTCGYVLKLPICYHSYPDFRSEFNNILTSSMWVMDVV